MAGLRMSWKWTSNRANQYEIVMSMDGVDGDGVTQEFDVLQFRVLQWFTLRQLILGGVCCDPSSRES